MDLPFHVIPVITDDQVRVRVYRGPGLEVELPLRRRQALVLASQLLKASLTAEGSADPLVLEAGDEQRVADKSEALAHGVQMGAGRKPVEVFRHEGNAYEHWLTANPDGSLPYHRENSGWAYMRSGPEGRDETITPDAAKKRWPRHAAAIDRALAVSAARPTGSG